jgi:hypothetical protein
VVTLLFRTARFLFTTVAGGAILAAIVVTVIARAIGFGDEEADKATRMRMAGQTTNWTRADTIAELHRT